MIRNWELIDYVLAVLLFLVILLEVQFIYDGIKPFLHVIIRRDSWNEEKTKLNPINDAVRKLLT